jgi:hypothetical protein
MNKQELIEKIEAIPAHNTRTKPWIDKKIVLGLIRQLDEPQKVVVPQFVADWIETAKKAAYNIRGAIDLAPKGKVKDWLELKNVNIFAEAWVNGYEVEKEKRYTVTVKGDIKEKLLVYGKTVKRYFFTKDYDLYNVIYSHTRKQLEEAGFGWIFSCEGIEVKEVE